MIDFTDMFRSKGLKEISEDDITKNKENLPNLQAVRRNESSNSPLKSKLIDPKQSISEVGRDFLNYFCINI
jgi:hypothetical protein